jgi:hypothetical protein
MVVMVELLAREPEGSKLVLKTYGQWHIPRHNFNVRSLKLSQAAIEQDPCLEDGDKPKKRSRKTGEEKQGQDQ